MKRGGVLTPLILVVAGCIGGEAPSRRTALSLTPCHLEGLDTPTECGTWSVWEDRSAEVGRRLVLAVAVVPAVKPGLHDDPVFFLAGGPGQGAREVASAVMPLFADLHEGRDIVFLDQRGTGGSHRLGCDPPAGDTIEGGLHAPLDGAWLRECRDHLDADLRFYTTPIAMDDLDEVRAALGYDRINLYGGSYGTRAGLVYMRQHADHVRTAVLDGVAPPSMELFLHFAEDGQAALDATLKDCAAAPECAAAFPGFAESFDALLAGAPYAVTLHHPRTGAAEAFTLERRDIAGLVRGMLYVPQLASLLPLDIARAQTGAWEPMIAQGAALAGELRPRPATWLHGLDDVPSREDRGISLGMLLSVVCTEDIPRITMEAREHAAVGSFLGDSLTGEVVRACADWPGGPLPDGYNDPVVSDVPTLLLSGGLDPVTPPRWGEEAARHLSGAVHGIAPNAGHNVLPLGCAADLMTMLVEDGSVDRLDVRCLTEIRRPPFFIDLQGPAF